MISTAIPLPYFLLIIRLILASVMLYYGWLKIRDLKANARDFEGMGFRPGIYFGTPVAIVEFVGGLMVLFGLYVELAAALFAFQMILGTFWKIKVGKDFTHYSYDMLALAVCGVIVGFGGGALVITSWQYGAAFALRVDVIITALILAGLGAWWSNPGGSKPKQEEVTETEDSSDVDEESEE